MKFKKSGKVITVEISETEWVTFYEMSRRGPDLVAGVSGLIEGNEFRYDGLFPKKYGRGKLKNEKEFYNKLDQVEQLLLDNKLRLTY